MIRRLGTIAAVAAGGILLTSCSDVYEPELTISGAASADGQTMEVTITLRDGDATGPFSSPPPRHAEVSLVFAQGSIGLGHSQPMGSYSIQLDTADTAGSVTVTVDLTQVFPAADRMCAVSTGIPRVDGTDTRFNDIETCVAFTHPSATTTTTTTSTSTTSTSTTSTSTTTPTIPVTPPTT